jgi:hypothetical protein
MWTKRASGNISSSSRIRAVWPGDFSTRWVDAVLAAQFRPFLRGDADQEVGSHPVPKLPVASESHLDPPAAQFEPRNEFCSSGLVKCREERLGAVMRAIRRWRSGFESRSRHPCPAPSALRAGVRRGRQPLYRGCPRLSPVSPRTPCCSPRWRLLQRSSSEYTFPCRGQQSEYTSGHIMRSAGDRCRWYASHHAVENVERRSQLMVSAPVEAAEGTE